MVRICSPYNYCEPKLSTPVWMGGRQSYDHHLKSQLADNQRAQHVKLIFNHLYSKTRLLLKTSKFYMQKCVKLFINSEENQDQYCSFFFFYFA